MEEAIAANILEKLQRVTGISGKWKPARLKKNTGIDGYIQLTIQKRSFRFPVELKSNIYKYAYPALLRQKKSNVGFTVMAENIQPAMKQTLKKAGINYIDGAGNAFVQAGGYFIYVDGLKSEVLPKAMKAKPFGKAGLKVIFALFTHEELINETIREIAEKSDVSLDSAHKTITGLKQLGYLLPRNKKILFWDNKRELLERWMMEFDSRLKPGLLLGTFRFTNETDNDNWKRLPLEKDKTFWGGEPAGDLYTNYLKPVVLTLYTQENVVDIMKKYRLMPDLKGNIQIYARFWTGKSALQSAVPPLLAYTDLINAGNPRTIETAQKIYEKYLRIKF